MDWIILIVAGLFETAFAFCLEKMKGAKDKFGHRLWTMGFVVCLAASMWLLAVAVHTLPIGTAYPVWTGIGAVGTVLLGIVYFRERVSFARIFFILKSATKLFSVLLASKRPLITELADKLRLKYPLLPTISPCPTMRLEAIRSIIPISCRRYPKSV